ncbi:MAG: FtsX-like permease family protein [bacterium]|nr:FtsX-like permease family protein [bacterium]
MSFGNRNDPPSFLNWVAGRILQEESQKILTCDLDDQYKKTVQSTGVSKANRWYLKQLLIMIPGRIKNSLLWNMMMTKNYLKVALRNLRRHKTYSLINISGLAIGLAVCILLVQYITYELSYDSFHENSEDIYRVIMEDWAGSHGPVGPTAKADLPEVLDYVRINPIFANGVYSYEDKSFSEDKVYYASPSFLQVFSFKMLKGDPITALNDANTVVMTESAVRKYFGDEDPFDKYIMFRGSTEFKITGIIEDTPENSHMKFDMLVSVSSIKGDWKDKWYYSSFHNYILLRPGTDIEAFEKKLQDHYKTIEAGLVKDEHSGLNYFLQSMRSIHLHSNYAFELEKNGDIKTIYFLIIITVLILFSAWINYINLCTARSLERTREIGIRKVIGAFRSNVIGQFLLETFLVNIIAVVAALGIVMVTLPVFSSFTGIPSEITLWYTSEFWIFMLLMVSLGVIISGLYPSLAASSFKPVNIIKGKISERSGSNVLRKCLVVFQFVVSVALIAGTLTVFKQIQYMMGQDIGINIDRTMVIKAPVISRNSPVEERLTRSSVFKTELTKIPGITSSAASSFVPGEYILNIHGGRRTHEAKFQAKEFNILSIDDDFFEFYNIEMLAGRNFSEDFSADREKLILNNKALPLLNFENAEDAVGEKIYMEDRLFTIAGVVEDYHHQSLKYDYRPLIILNSAQTGGKFSVRLNTTDLNRTINSIESVWKEVFPGSPFEYFFQDEHFNRQYNTDIKFGQVSGLFTVIAIMIGCMGLFGLAMVNVSIRLKEIGIRKTLGASVPEIIKTLIADFFKIIIIAVVISVPLSYIYYQQWLTNYAFRIEIGWWFFIIPVVLISSIVFLTVSVQVIKAALNNPVKALRCE